jgi:hypothetical protein
MWLSDTNNGVAHQGLQSAPTLFRRRTASIEIQPGCLVWSNGYPEGVKAYSEGLPAKRATLVKRSRDPYPEGVQATNALPWSPRIPN